MSYSAVESWVSGSLEEAAEMLAKRAAVGRQVREMREKHAASKQSDLGRQVGDIWSGVRDTIANTPALQATLAGAGLGAGPGAISSLGAPPERKHPLRSMLTGGLAGAGIGLGGHMAYKNFSNLNLPKPSDTTTEVDIGGRSIKIDPNKLLQNPEMVDEIMRRKDPSMVNEAVNSLFGGAKDLVKEYPLYSSLIGADAATLLRGGLNRYSGAPTVGMRPGYLAKGVGSMMKEFGDTDGWKWLQNEATPDQLQQILAKVRTGAKTVATGAKGEAMPASRIMEAYFRGQGPMPAMPIADTLGAPNILKGLKSLGSRLKAPVSKLPGGEKAVGAVSGLGERIRKILHGDMTIPEGLEGTGWGRPNSQFSAFAKHVPGVQNSELAPGKTRYMKLLQKLHGSGPVESTAVMGLRPRLLARAGLYAGIPAYLAYRGFQNQDAENLNRIRELAAKLAVD